MTQLSNWCIKCGHPKSIDGTYTGQICECPPDIQPKLTGWRCPNCGAGVSPFTSSCPHCAPPYKITY